jgi:hypothetical protein
MENNLPSKKVLQKAFERSINDVLAYEDKFGLITQKNGDGGDTCQREGMFIFFIELLFINLLISKTMYFKMKKRFLTAVLPQLEVGNGIYRRHPDSTKWYSNPNNLSRDQQVSLVFSLGIFDEDKLRLLFERHKRRGGFYQNTRRNWGKEGWKIPDFAGPSHWGQYIRSFKAKGWRWLLYFCDFFACIHAISNAIRCIYDTDHSDDLNFVTSQLQAKYIWPTFWTNIANWIYRTFTKNPGTFRKTPDLHRGCAAFSWYFHRKFGGSPIDKLAHPLIKLYM